MTSSVVANGADALRENVRRWTLVLGVLQITVGCCVGFIPPAAVAWFRGIVMAHIEFTANGVLMIALGFLVRELRLSPTALKVWFAASANRHVDQRRGGRHRGLPRCFVEADADDQREVSATAWHG